MVDSSSYLNYPGLKYLQKNQNPEWDQDSSSFLSYKGLRRMDRGEPFIDSSKELLSKEGLEYLVLGRLVKIAKNKKKQEDEERWKQDTSILFEYNPETGDVTLFYDDGNESLYTIDNNPATLQSNGTLSMLVYKGRGLDGSIYIDDDGNVKITV